MRYFTIWLVLLAIVGCGMPTQAIIEADSTNEAEKTNITYTLDDWCNAIFKAEGGYSATWLYGIRSVAYDDEADARQICKNTVYNTLIKYRKTRCRPDLGDLSCIASRYCPVDGELDDGKCVHWADNVKYFLQSSL